MFSFKRCPCEGINLVFPYAFQDSFFDEETAVGDHLIKAANPGPGQRVRSTAAKGQRIESTKESSMVAKVVVNHLY